MAFTNRLISETSPYLLQHAHNPVEWYPWGDEALEKARKENKPILVSIGYAACHWCHVMERESFENEETAALMNENFVNIKIDREERPDLDHIYMEAVQAIAGNGGWPLNVFLTPETKPFYGGTYFPPQRALNRPSWKEILSGVSKAFRERRDEINTQAENLTSHLIRSNEFGLQTSAGTGAGETLFLPEDLRELFSNIMKSADKKDGGFGNAPKFPQTFSIQFLLHYYYYTKDTTALEQATLSLEKMINGGINDQLGGGFSRYSTDKEWLAPHFEKMLYDNALLIIVLSEAYQATGNSLFLDTIHHTLTFVERELLSPEGGFYSAIDADSEGVEGKYYVWDYSEILELLDKDALLFCEFYDVSQAGNWEHKNILRVKVSAGVFAADKNIPLAELNETLAKCRNKLFMKRQTRIRPMLDDKILMGWNALMNIAYSKAYAVSGEEKYRMLAIKNIQFLLKHFEGGNGQDFYHTYKNGKANHPAFLDDYAFIISALLHIQEITADPTYLTKAKTITNWVIAHFDEPETSYFYYTNDQQKDIVIRKKELYDGALPSGNSVMAWNLYYLGSVFDNSQWKERSVKLCGALKEVIIKYPTSFGVWATLVQSVTYIIPEIIITGENIENIQREILRTFIPSKILQSATREEKDFPLLTGKSFSKEAKIYLCKANSCQSPVNEVNALLSLLEIV